MYSFPITVGERVCFRSLMHERMVVSLTLGAVSVLQTETGLVSLCHPGAIQCQQVVMCEHLDAVVVPGTKQGKVLVRVCMYVYMCVYVCWCMEH